MTVSFKTGISLRTQLYGLLVGIALISFIGSSWVSIDTTKGYLNDQMKSHAQDAATSVGLSISPYMDSDNSMIVETMIVAIFDSGYYQKVFLTDANNNIVMSRENNLIIDGVPSWFVSFFELTSPVMSSEVNNGWEIAGTLSFQSHIGTSYEKLWQHAVNNFYSSLLITLLAFLIAHFILRSVLHPLNEVEAQALSVSNKNFTFIKNIPMTRELKTVINAMNIMVTNTQASFDSASEQANKLTKEIFIDDLTQLGNRRAFVSQFQTLLSDMKSIDFATIGLVQLQSLQVINDKLGYNAGDDYVCNAALLIKTKLNEFKDAKAYRVSGGSFFFIINSVDDDVVKFCEDINNEFSTLNSNYYEHGFGKAVASSFNNTDVLGTLLPKLDTLLTQESSATSSGEVYFGSNTQVQYGFHEWSKLIDELIETNHIEFAFQPVMSTYGSLTDDVLFYEFFSQFLKNNEVVSNNQLYSMAERTNKSQELDKLVLTKLTNLKNIDLSTKISINLTHQSLHSKDFREWLKLFINQNKKNLPRLVFEVNEEAILGGINSSIDFILKAKTLGIEICIDRFGSSFTSFKYLKGLNVDYIKIDGSYTQDFDVHQGNKDFIYAVTQIAHGVGIKVLTSHVESSKSKNLLTALNCDGMQGNVIQKPLTLMSKNIDFGCIYSPIELQ